MEFFGVLFWDYDETHGLLGSQFQLMGSAFGQTLNSWAHLPQKLANVAISLDCPPSSPRHNLMLSSERPLFHRQDLLVSEDVLRL